MYARKKKDDSAKKKDPAKRILKILEEIDEGKKKHLAKCREKCYRARGRSIFDKSGLVVNVS